MEFEKFQGIVAFHVQSQATFKYTYEGDDLSKWQLAQGER